MPVAIHGITKCDFCQRPPDMNCGNQEEELLCCKDCNTKAHPSCMNYTPELALRAHQSPWQCPTCKVCSICKDSGNVPAMLICDSCDKGFHVQCLYSPLEKSPSGELAIAGHWVCSMCSKQDIKENDNSKLVSSSEELMTIKKEACTYGPPTPSESPEPNLTEMQQDFPRKRNLYDGPYPDVTDYTIEDVVKFFKSKGFTKEASAFSEQEIDGKSLLLMKRDDVLVGLRDYICLGPALKIFKHVERLQWASE
ncbi:atherin-like isoform X1 [Octopus sinensis]|uniref:Atherin-like isoform X1 n=1 Tax=Octopus sinensis TaxID=2607531 RepID=A0A6P7TJG8_9MOLL|nr:atherin-like isoform X1 [Octopus sinensis]